MIYRSIYIWPMRSSLSRSLFSRSLVFVFCFLDTLRFHVECRPQIYRLSFIYSLIAISWITWMRPVDWHGQLAVGFCKLLVFIQYNISGFHLPIRPVIPDDYNLMQTIKITSKVALRTSEVLPNYKIFSKILIRFIHLPCVLIASLIHLKLLE